jgi:hypothetical protein
MPLNVTGKDTALDGLDESIAAGILFVGVNTLVSAPPTDTSPGTGATAAATEATGGTPAYERQAVTWDPASGGLKENSSALTFDVDAGTYGFLTFWDSSAGNTGTEYRGYAPLNGSVKGFGTVDAAGVTSNTITSAAHGLVNTNRVILFNTFAETIPAGITEGAAYFVVGVTTDTFQISLTSGGAAVDLTTIGEVFFQQVVPETFGAQGQITVAISALVLDLTGI